MAHALLAYYSVRLPKNQYPYVSMHTDYLYILTKNLTTQSAHQNYAVLPKFLKNLKNHIFCHGFVIVGLIYYSHSQGNNTKTT